MISNPYFLVLLGLFLSINLLAFVMILLDKIKSQKEGSERISEGMLFFMASAFGSIGVYAGMFAARHKTRKWYFLVGIPMLVFQNIATIFLLYLWLEKFF